ncbi:polymorphic toxin type 44 domain-containing protein [Oscillibacter sp.]|uniref:polymorphic toxin type 44 domain-containing protein n=1 Tax=Oscillibacter sp. TaxID=1945593 RepID=UPI00289FD238|nr:polymorphic toxin type 44 domain-containing protein [Oscillibacter sp.]
MISIALCFSFCIGQVAATPVSFTSDDKAFSYIWVSLRNSGDLSVGSDGLLQVNADNPLLSVQGYESFLNMINICNDSIKNGIIAVDANTVEIFSVLKPDEEPAPPNFTQPMMETTPILREDGHGCSVEHLNLLLLCSRNYETLENYYQEMLRLSLVNPNLSPWGATAGFWVNKVEPNGEWDYKVQPGYAPWNRQFCCYFDGSYHHITSEYIGNFNYGYTGQLLFNLSILHFGSSAVSGFDPADKSDWPAIDAGFEISDSLH